MAAADVVSELVLACRAAIAEDDAPVVAGEVLARCLRDRRRDLLVRLAGCTELVVWHQTPELSVLVLPTSPGFEFWPHEHGMWAVTGMVVGTEHNTLYDVSDQGLAVSRRFDVAEGAVCVHDRRIVHTAANLGSSVSLGVHIFGGDPTAVAAREWDPVSGTERIVDSETSARRRAAMAAYRQDASRSELVARDLTFGRGAS